MKELINSTETINRLLARYGVKFGIYKNGEFKEQLFPFDPIPRIIQNSEFQFLERGLKQRIGAVYRRISYEHLDPMTFCGESVVGNPHQKTKVTSYKQMTQVTVAASVI